MTLVYRTSEDVGALTLTGEVGSLAALLTDTLGDAGWTTAYTGTNLAAYRQAACEDGALRAYLRVDDAGPGSDGAQEARIVGYETMSDVNTGARAFPTAVQSADGLFVRKSATADSTERPWILLADGRTVKMWMRTGDVAGVWAYWTFGDYYSYRLPYDLYRTYIQARFVEGSALQTSSVDGGNVLSGNVTQAVNGCYLVRSQTQEVGAVQAGLVGNPAFGSPGVGGYSARYGEVAYKNPTDQLVYLPQIQVTEPTAPFGVRGLVRGEYASGHPSGSLGHGALIEGTQDLGGTTLVTINEGGHDGPWIVEYSDTWATNSPEA